MNVLTSKSKPRGGDGGCRVYLATPWTYQAEARELGKQLARAGHTVTSSWLGHTETYKDEDLREQAQIDYRDLRNSDCLLLVNWAKSEGKATELGIALEREIPIISVYSHDSTSIFTHLPQVQRVETIAAALKALESI